MYNLHTHNIVLLSNRGNTDSAWQTHYWKCIQIFLNIVGMSLLLDHLVQSLKQLQLDRKV